MEEINAILGIDLDAATPEQIAKRAYEFAIERADCYDEGDFAYEGFMALSVVINMMRGGQ